MGNEQSQTEVEVTVTPEPSAETLPENPGEVAEVIAEAETEVAETHADATVQVAAIEAARDLEIAGINADLERERIEAAKSERDLHWQGQIASLQEQNNQKANRIAELEQQLTPPPSQEEVTILTPQSTLDETNETQTEVIPESVGVNPGAEAAALVRRVRRAI